VEIEINVCATNLVSRFWNWDKKRVKNVKIVVIVEI
jgi:hypothetical protein